MTKFNRNKRLLFFKFSVRKNEKFLVLPKTYIRQFCYLVSFCCTEILQFYFSTLITDVTGRTEKWKRKENCG